MGECLLTNRKPSLSVTQKIQVCDDYRNQFTYVMPDTGFFTATEHEQSGSSMMHITVDGVNVHTWSGSAGGNHSTQIMATKGQTIYVNSYRLLCWAQFLTL